MSRRWGIAAVTVCLVALTACGGTGNGSATKSPAPGQNTPIPTPKPGPPNIGIMSPPNGSTVPAGDVQVIATWGHFKVANSAEPAPDEGFVHYYIDLEALPTTPGRPAVPDDTSKYQSATTSYIVWKNVKSGVHTFSAQLVHADHTPLDPPVTATTRVTVR